MSYYKYMVSSYQSSLPVSSSRGYRANSVERSSYSSSSAGLGTARFTRATTAPPAMGENASYFGVMPFNRSLTEIEDRIRLRAGTERPVNTYRRAYTTSTPYGATTSFDYKVMDYANSLDREETTRSYINTLRSDYSARATYGSAFDSPHSTWGSAYKSRSGLSSDQAYADRVASRSNCDAYRVDSRDLYSYRHYRKSNATLEERNSRAKSPMLSREIDRYYKTERRSSYLGDISSGGQRDFRYYNYRHVPYYGGSDYYSYVPRVARVWNGETYPMNVPTYPVTTNSIY